MRKLILAMMILLALTSCSLDTSYEYEKDDKTIYLLEVDFAGLLDRLELTTVTRQAIDNELTALDVRLNYDYSNYVSDDYTCHTFLWSYYGSTGWVYYVSVDIWEQNGILERSMCSYYKD